MVITGLSLPLAYWSRTVVPTILSKARASLPAPGASTEIASRRVGCVNVNSRACKRNPTPCHRGRAIASSAPYFPSPTIGQAPRGELDAKLMASPGRRPQLHLGETLPSRASTRKPTLASFPASAPSGTTPDRLSRAVLLEPVGPFPFDRGAPLPRSPSRAFVIVPDRNWADSRLAALLVFASSTTPDVGRSSRCKSPT